ncbi:MAG: WD40 repeat protein [Candidatus Azotimanducaceae bacterium]|jgi:WD40 repeat protein
MLLRSTITFFCLLVSGVPLTASSQSIFSVDGRTIATVASDNTVLIWETGSRQQNVDIKGHDGIIYSIQFSPDGRQLLTASGDGTAKLWSVHSGEVLATLRMEGDVLDARFSGDGRKVLTRSSKGKLGLWFSSDGARFDALAHFENVSQADLSPKGSRVVATLYDGHVEVWDEYLDQVNSVNYREEAAATTGSKSADSNTHTSVATMLRQWATAWSLQDAEAYLGFYSARFKPSDNQSLDTWRLQRLDRVKGPSMIDVSFDGLEVVQAKDQSILASFSQRYQSDRLADVCQKELVLAPEPGGYRILAETTVSCR